MSRAESAAATRRALLNEAAALLDSGGPEAVTLREVGARAGVTRGAPYGHFADKGRLLTAVAAMGWDRVADEMHALRGQQLAAADRLRAAVHVLIDLNRRQPHLYQLMFTPPAGDPGAVIEGAQRLCDEFHALAADIAGEHNADRYAAILLTGAHGVAGLESSGLLGTDSLRTSAENLIDTYITLLTEERPHARM